MTCVAAAPGGCGRSTIAIWRPCPTRRAARVSHPKRASCLKATRGSSGLAPRRRRWPVRRNCRRCRAVSHRSGGRRPRDPRLRRQRGASHRAARRIAIRRGQRYAARRCGGQGHADQDHPAPAGSVPGVKAPSPRQPDEQQPGRQERQRRAVSHRAKRPHRAASRHRRRLLQCPGRRCARRIYAAASTLEAVAACTA